ncbi:MAG TPA: hypothetical protein VMW35_03050 [Myxococcota bacterium]|jgi:hypothetical protein|nr:hypothetical protein [Myxococcota bacterium]
MHRTLHRLPALLGLLLCLFTATGCDLQWVNVVIPDFGSKQVKGVWIWRLSEQTGQYVRDTEIVFETTANAGGHDILSYETTSGPLGERGTLPTELVHDAQNPDQVTLQMGFMRLSAPGSFRVSTYNVAGDSPLSAASVQL